MDISVFDHFFRQSFLYYMYTPDWVVMALMLGEWTGFVMVAYYSLALSPWWAAFFTTPILCMSWVVTWEFSVYSILTHYGYLKGIIP